MAKFHVKETFEIPSRDLFVMAGDLVSGTVRAGMLIHIRLNSQVATTVPIYRIETAQLTDQRGRQFCLCVRGSAEDRQILRGMNIRDEVVDVLDASSE